MPLTLLERWNADLASLPGETAVKTQAFEEIIAAYSQPQRRYHGVGHLEALFGLLDQHAASVQLPLPLHFAVWWHDVVYEPQASDNEAASAHLACTRLTTLGAKADLVDEVAELILATRNHWQGPSRGNGDYFLDADIAILGAPREAYDRYAADVRIEYGFAADPVYRAGRSAFLSHAIARQPLFRTTAFEAAYGAQARANMQRELKRLNGA